MERVNVMRDGQDNDVMSQFVTRPVKMKEHVGHQMNAAVLTALLVAAAKELNAHLSARMEERVTPMEAVRAPQVGLETTVRQLCVSLPVRMEAAARHRGGVLVSRGGEGSAAQL